MQKKLTRSRGIRREATAAPPLAVAHVCAAAPPWAASSPREVATRVRAIAPPWAASSPGRHTCHGSLGGGPPLVVVGDDLP